MDTTNFFVPIEPEQFESWRKEFPRAFVLNCDTSMMHRADCHHFNLSEGKSHTPKWVSPSLGPLQKLAESRGWGPSVCGCID